jgi:hypothetical protein
MPKESDKRRYRRFVVEGLQGNVLYTSDLEILNISIDGAAIETTKRLELNREYTFKINYKDNYLSIKGRVVWAILITKEIRQAGKSVPVYRAGVAFSDTVSEKAHMLMDFIEESRIKRLGQRLGGVRFKIARSDNIKIDLPYRYTVKKISLSGMLAETEYPLELDSYHDIELFLNEHPVRIVGRVVNCEQLQPDTPIKYGIGIEFIQISDNQSNMLRNYLSTLEDA